MKDKLRTRSLSDREAFPYLVLFSGSAFVSAFFPPLVDYNVWDWIGIGVSIVLVISGILYAYKANGGSRGFDLIQKYVVLGWIVVVRCTLVFVPVATALFFVGEALGLMSEITNWYDVLIFSMFQAVLYQRIGRHIKDTK